MALPKPYYEDAGSGIVIYNADSRIILPELTGVDLVLTDVPYGTETNGYGRMQNHGGNIGRKIIGDKCLTMAGEVLELARQKIANGYIMTFCSPSKIPLMFPLVRDAEYIGEIIWDKLTPGLGYGVVRYAHESALLWTVGEPDKPTQSLLSVVNQSVNRFNTQAFHPHEKPVTFWTNALNLPGKLACDPFMGSGNVLRACKDLKRACIGIEIEEKFCAMAVENLRQEVLL